MEKIELINELVSDHWQIRDLIQNLRAEKTPRNQKLGTLTTLAEWLKWHGEGEDKTLNRLGKERRSLKVLAYEDEEEHATVGDLLQKIAHTRNPYLWAARLHLICELVEHHLDEEEEEYFPLLRQAITAEESERLAKRYRVLTAALEEGRPQTQIWFGPLGFRPGLLPPSGKILPCRI